MDHLRTWLLGIIFTSFAAGLANELVPKGRERIFVRMVSGALVMLAMLRPLGTFSWDKVRIPVGDFSGQIERQADAYRLEQQKTLSAIIAERTQSYIWDKATELGLDCTVRVRVTKGEGNIPLPEMVELGAAYDPVLAVWIEEVVGIPAQNQIWLEESAWEKRMENG